MKIKIAKTKNGQMHVEELPQVDKFHTFSSFYHIQIKLILGRQKNLNLISKPWLSVQKILIFDLCYKL